MRDCVFLVADKNMQFAFEGFLTRPDFHRSLGCGIFDFNTAADLIVASGDNDPGLYIRAHEILRSYQKTHRHAVITLDVQWKGAPGGQAIVDHISSQILSTGWQEGTFQVIAIDPELETWIWQQNDHVARNLGFSSRIELMKDDSIRASWPSGQYKPSCPKETLEAVLRKRNIPRSSAIYKRITSQVSIRGCKDSSFQLLLQTLRRWFPVEDIEGDRR
jgi:hypothetical protein